MSSGKASSVGLHVEFLRASGVAHSLNGVVQYFVLMSECDVNSLGCWEIMLRYYPVVTM